MSAGWKYPWLPWEDVVSTPCGGVRGLHTHSHHTHTLDQMPQLFQCQDSTACRPPGTESQVCLQWEEMVVVCPFFISYIIVKHAFFPVHRCHCRPSPLQGEQQTPYIDCSPTEGIYWFHTGRTSADVIVTWPRQDAFLPPGNDICSFPGWVQQSGKECIRAKRWRQKDK